MERLEACYFCGTAEDPLREVTVTPRRRQDDPDAAVTLTLCASCEGKLERVLGGLFEHVESRERAEPSAGGGADEEPAADPETVDRIDVASEAAVDASGTEPDELVDDPPDPAALAGDVSADDDPGDLADDDEPEADDAEIIGEEETVTARATVNSKEALDGVSVAEYNKVMRLLQNREFPMDRVAFVDLAANAYDLAEGTVETVLEAVIDQGALADRDGELVRPGEEGSA